SAAAGDGRDDRDLVGVLDGRLEALEEADVLVVGEDVHELAHLAAVVADAFLEARVLRLEARDQRADGRARGRDLLLALRELAERRGDADGGHGECLLVLVEFRCRRVERSRDRGTRRRRARGCAAPSRTRRTSSWG